MSMPPAGERVIVGGMAPQIDKIPDHERGATIEDCRHPREIGGIEVDDIRHQIQCLKYFCNTFQTAVQVGPMPPPMPGCVTNCPGG